MKTLILVAFAVIIISCRQEYSNSKILVKIDYSLFNSVDSTITVKYINESKDSLFSAIKLLRLPCNDDCNKGKELLVNDSCCVDVIYSKIVSKLNQSKLNQDFRVYGNSFLSSPIDKDVDLLFGLKLFKINEEPTFIFLLPKTEISIFYRIKNDCKVPLKGIGFFENNERNKLYDLSSNKKYKPFVENKFKGYRFVIP